MIMPTKEGKLTTLEASEILGVSDAYLRRLLGRGDFPGEKFGDQWSLDVSEVESRRESMGRRGKRASAKAVAPRPKAKKR
jgi:excisionase family DNA binding protein